MRALIPILIVIGVLGCVTGLIFSTVQAASGTSPDQEMIKAMNIQNQQLKRIADDLDIIAGRQPGWKAPK